MWNTQEQGRLQEVCILFFLSLFHSFGLLWVNILRFVFQSSGQEKAVPKSKYEEDVFVNNHTVRTAFFLFPCMHTYNYL